MIKDSLTDVFNNYHMGITAGIWPSNVRSPATTGCVRHGLAEQASAARARAASGTIARSRQGTRKGADDVDNDEYSTASAGGLAGLRRFQEGRHGHRRQYLASTTAPRHSS